MELLWAAALNSLNPDAENAELREVINSANSDGYDVVFYDRKEYTFGNKVLRAKRFINKESHVIECICEGKTLWEMRHWAYLCTEIIEKNGCVIFGTDGMGGRLYCVSLETGQVLSETKTHFSGFYDFRGFNWHNGNIVVYGKGTLCVINPFTGEVVDEHKIPSQFLYRSFLKVLNGKAYACVTTNSNAATLFCFKLS